MNDYVDPITQEYINKFHRRNRAMAAFWRQAIPVIAMARARKDWETANTAKTRRRLPVWLGLGLFLFVGGIGVGFLLGSVLSGGVAADVGEPDVPRVAPVLVSPIPTVQASPSPSPERTPKDSQPEPYEPM